MRAPLAALASERAEAPRAPTGYRVLDVGCGDRAVRAAASRRRGATYVGLRRRGKPRCRHPRVRSDALPGRGRELRRRPLPAGARARARIPARAVRELRRVRQARRPRARLDARRRRLPPVPGRLLALDAARGLERLFRDERRPGRRSTCGAGAGTAAYRRACSWRTLSTSSSSAAGPGRLGGRLVTGAEHRAGERSTTRSPMLRESDTRLDSRELPRRRRSPDGTRLVTGGAGFIGSNLVRALLERGDEVRVLDNFSTGNRANLDGLDVEIVEGELRSYERVHNAVRKAEIVYHLGALGSVPRSVQDPLTSSAVNVEGTLNVLLAARDEGVRRVVFSSSTSVYGSSRRLPTPEEEPLRPDLAVRRREARGRALLHQLQPRLRLVRDGRAALLQRLRAASEPVLAVRRGRCRCSSRRSPPASR